MQATQANYHQQLQQLSLCVHPFAIDGSGFQTTAQVMDALQTPLQALKDLPLVTALPQSAAALDQFARLIPDLAAVINTWWTWVRQVLMTENLDSETTDWLITCLLPLVYWQQQLTKTKSPTLRTQYQTAYSQAQQHYHRHPSTKLASPAQIQHWTKWALVDGESFSTHLISR